MVKCNNIRTIGNFSFSDWEEIMKKQVKIFMIIVVIAVIEIFGVYIFKDRNQETLHVKHNVTKVSAQWRNFIQRMQTLSNYLQKNYLILKNYRDKLQ